MAMVGFPLLLIPLAIYNMIVLLMPGVSLAEPVVKLPLLSGAEWSITLGDMLLALGVIMLLFEVIKGARPGAKFLTDHLLSLIIFGCAAAEFLLWPRFGNSIFFLLVLLALADFLSGMALRVRRAAQAAPVASRESRRAAPASPLQPRSADPEIPVASPSPEVPSPELQPGNDATRPSDPPAH